MKRSFMSSGSVRVTARGAGVLQGSGLLLNCARSEHAGYRNGKPQPSVFSRCSNKRGAKLRVCGRQVINDQRTQLRP